MARKRQTTDRQVGTCACGTRIMLGDRYSISTERPQTVDRACAGCNRINEIVLTVRIAVKPMDWAAHECLCGSTIYLRSEYAGPGFEGYKGEYASEFRRAVMTEDDRKAAYRGRTVKTPCRNCGCAYIIKISFKLDKEGERRTRDTSVKVYRCKTCRARKERLENAS